MLSASSNCLDIERRAKLQIDAIYEPVQKDLLQVEEGLKDFAQADFPWMRELLEHILNNGGKRIRPALALLAGKLYSYQPDLLFPMATGVELLHIATLVHDDTIDNSLVRRGKPTINSLWGQSAAVLLGDYLFSGAAHLVSSTGNVPVMRLFAQTLMTISSGELQEGFMAYNLRQTREDYYQRIAAKTASLFSLAAQSGAILSQASEEAVKSLKDYGHNLGLSFQIVDDILDFIGEEEEMGKPVGSDLIHGNITLPAILFLERHPQSDLIEKAFGKGSGEDFERALEGICNSAIIEECYRIASDYCSRACHALKTLPHNASHKALLDLTDYVIERKK